MSFSGDTFSLSQSIGSGTPPNNQFPPIVGDVLTDIASGLSSLSASITGLTLSSIGFPVGTVLDYAGGTAPTNWVLCYGQEISRSTYSALFTVIGTTYGVGDGSTTFNLPDLRGVVLAGKDDMGGSAAGLLTSGGSGISGTNLGASGGSETHTLSTGELASHTHGAGTFTAANHHHTYTNYPPSYTSAQVTTFGGADNASPNETTGVNTGDSGSLTVSGTSGSEGSGSAHNNTQPTFILNKIMFAGA